MIPWPEKTLRVPQIFIFFESLHQKMCRPSHLSDLNPYSVSKSAELNDGDPVVTRKTTAPFLDPHDLDPWHEMFRAQPWAPSSKICRSVRHRFFRPSSRKCPVRKLSNANVICEGRLWLWSVMDSYFGHIVFADMNGTSMG